MANFCKSGPLGLSERIGISGLGAGGGLSPRLVALSTPMSTGLQACRVTPLRSILSLASPLGLDGGMCLRQPLSKPGSSSPAAVPTSAALAPTATAAAAAAAAATRLITIAVLQAAEAKPTDDYYASIVNIMNDYAEAYSVNTKLRVAHFLAQIGHESGFRIIEENGNYSAKRMREIFGCKGGPKNYDKAKDECVKDRLRDKLWTEEATYAKNAKNLLGYVYASRGGNGDEASGDGYKFRGRGMIQLTFKNNYKAFTTAHNAKVPADQRDFVAAPELLITELKYGVESAFYFWDANSINALADTDDINKVTMAVNGGLNGLADRQARLTQIKKALNIK